MSLYEIDTAFDEQLNRIEKSEDYVLIWACCLTYGYTIEVLDKKGHKEYRFDITGHNIHEVKNWIDNLLNDRK